MTWVPRLVREHDRGVVRLADGESGLSARTIQRRQSSMEGSAFFHFPDQIPVADAELAGWLADGTIVMAEHVLDGIDRYPEALESMFSGGNVGKLLGKAT